ncbi:hypothetical protein ACJJTC_009597 [Scirpophaga incertulas]
MKCDKCGDNATDGVECSYCQCFYHFGCAGIAEICYRKMGAEKKASWRCVKCRTLTKTDPSISDILQELKNLREEIGEIKSFKTEFQTLKTEINSVSEKISILDSKWEGLETRLLTFENRRTTLETKVFGLEGENLNNLMFTLSTKAGISLNEKDLDSIHRVRRFETKSHIGGIGNKTASTESRPPAIIVKFTRRIVKDQLFAAVRARRGINTTDIGLSGPASTIYVSDHLTPSNKLLLRQARQLKADMNYSYLWISDCKIFLRKNDKSKQVQCLSLRPVGGADGASRGGGVAIAVRACLQPRVRAWPMPPRAAASRLHYGLRFLSRKILKVAP